MILPSVSRSCFCCIAAYFRPPRIVRGLVPTATRAIRFVTTHDVLACNCGVNSCCARALQNELDVTAQMRDWLSDVLRSPLRWPIKEEILCRCTTEIFRMGGQPTVGPPAGDMDEAVVLWCLAQRCPLQDIESSLKLHLHSSFIRHAGHCTLVSSAQAGALPMVQTQSDEAGQAPPLFLPQASDNADFLCRRVGGKRDDQYGMRVMSTLTFDVERALRSYGVRCVTLDFSQEYHVRVAWRCWCVMQCDSPSLRRPMLADWHDPGCSAVSTHTGGVPEAQSVLCVCQGALSVRFRYLARVQLLARLVLCLLVCVCFRSVSNTLWKWCAEYTQRNPWVFVFFFGALTSWLLPENLDRCVREIGANSRQAHDDDPEALVAYPKLQEPVIPIESFSKTSRMNPEWEVALREASARARWVLLCGAPGIGKTYHIKHEFLPELQHRSLLTTAAEGSTTDQAAATPAANVSVTTIDGSNDRFTREALADVLAREVQSHPAHPTWLLVDEFHLMPVGALVAAIGN